MNALIQSADPQVEWLYHAPPVGLVLGANVIRENELIPERQTAIDTATVEELLRKDRDGPALADHWGFFSHVLGWEARYVAGAPDGPPLPERFTVSIPEGVVSADWAVRDLGTADAYQLLVKLCPEAEADTPGLGPGWKATPHQQLERLLRETGIAIGVLVDRENLRVLYAPHGETSGWQTFPLRSLAAVAGRPMLGGLKLLLGHARLFTEPGHLRLPKLLVRSRAAQNKVSEELAEQVLGALHELLRAFHAADPGRIEALAAGRPEHLYEGLLTALLRLVFLLYAEDRELMPALRTPEAIDIYEKSYSVRGLYARLAQDRALNPDTMDERLGGWGQLLALFRLVHGGHRSGWIAPRGGKLFDPEAFPFLECREAGEPLRAAKVLPIRDGAILRILEGLMTLEAKSFSGERVRERLSYRSLDVEQIGSVYETVMGFKVMPAPSPMIAVKGEKNLPVFVELEALAQKSGADRQKMLKGAGVAPSANRLAAIKTANGVDELKQALLAIVDERGSPGGHVSLKGAPVLQPTDERRRSGSHYTPRSLTEPIVRHALEPAFDRLGENATPDQVLELKICDPACGSGAFLVEASRQLGTRLQAAWTHHPALKPPIPRDEDDDIHARRLVAQRCLYGVDKNPMAVDLARLSLWLATLARDHEFTFLDHAIKCGDSLVGLTKAQIEAVNWDSSKPGLALLGGMIRQRVNEVVTGRREIQFAPDDVSRAIQEARHRIVETRLVQPRVYGDAVIAAFFSADKPRARETKRAELESLILSDASANWPKIAALAATLETGPYPVNPFHWELEFPEVFVRDDSGFDVIVGNPPFAGKNTIASSNKDGFSDWLLTTHVRSHGNSDLVAYFFRQAFSLLRGGGCAGLIATNTIGQGDTRDTGLAFIISSGGSIYHAVKRLKWPGGAAVVVSVVHVCKGQSNISVLNGRVVERISALLGVADIDTSPPVLHENLLRAFAGVEPGSDGFLFSQKPSSTPISVALDLLKNPHNPAVIKPYIGTDEVNTNPRHLGDRYAVDFGAMPLMRVSVEEWENASDERREHFLSEGLVAPTFAAAVAQDWPEVLEVVDRKVRGNRSKGTNGHWWQYRRMSKDMAIATHGLPSVLCVGRSASPHLAVARIAQRQVIAKTLCVFAFNSASAFCALQSRPHEIWARFFSSSMKDDLRYAPSDCFETFPFSRNFETNSTLQDIGQRYHDHRAALMIAHNQGMTTTYNRFHDVNEHSADIVRLRELHAEMDRAVLRAYGWDDLADRAEPQFLNEDTEDDHTYQGRLFWPADFRREVLARLLKLNAERHAEEVRLGLHKSGNKRPADAEDEDDLFGDTEAA